MPAVWSSLAFALALVLSLPAGAARADAKKKAPPANKKPLASQKQKSAAQQKQKHNAAQKHKTGTFHGMVVLVTAKGNTGEIKIKHANGHIKAFKVSGTTQIDGLNVKSLQGVQ